MISQTLIPAEKLNSASFKRTLASHLYWRLGFEVVCDEFQFMDIFGVRKNGYTVEFEIKVSKSDFDRELRCILSDDCQQYGKDWKKFSKHKKYLTGERVKTEYDLRMESFGVVSEKPVFRPNEFNFYVPDFLAEYAALQCEGLPYGVIKNGKKEIPSGQDYVWPYTVVKKAQKLHTDKCSLETYSAVAHALTIRSKLMN